MKTINDPLNLKAINDNAIQAVDRHYKKRDLLDDEIAMIEKETEERIKAINLKKQRMKYPHFERVFKNLFQKMKEELKADTIKIYGVFGLSCESSVYFEKNKKTIASLCFIRPNNGWMIRDENKDTKKYPKGSIAGMNGDNYPTIKITEKMDVKWLIKFAKKGC